MGKRKVSYSSSWEAEFKWLRSTNDSSETFCTVCSKNFRIDNSGKSEVEIHGQGTFHKQQVKTQKDQQTFVRSTQENSVVMSEVSSSLSMEEQVLRAEIIQAL